MSRRKITPQLPEIERLPKLNGQLGKVPDLHLSRQYNLSLSAVRARRVALGIEPVSRGRPTGQAKVKVSLMLCEVTAHWLERKHPAAKSLAAAAGKALDELAGEREAHAARGAVSANNNEQ